MKNDEKAIIAGAGAILAYFFLQRNEGKILNISDPSIYPTEFFV